MMGYFNAYDKILLSFAKKVNIFDSVNENLVFISLVNSRCLDKLVHMDRIVGAYAADRIHKVLK